MADEDLKDRRGEPVLITHDEQGRPFDPPLPATIEWGSDARGYSLYSERDGRSTGRFRSRAEWMRADPGGARPVWQSLTRS